MVAAWAGRGGEMQSDRHERITERAYQIWVAEGRVHGRHDEHWRRAEREIAEQELKVAAALANRAAGLATTPRRRPPAAPAAPTTAAAKKPAAKRTVGKSSPTPAASAPQRRKRTPT